MCGKVFRALRVPLAIRLAQSAQGSSASWQMRRLRFVWQLLSQPCSVNPRHPWQARHDQSKKAVPKSSLYLDPNERRLGQPSDYAWRRNLEIDIIAGPCAIESRDQAFAVAEAVQKSGARFFRGGVWKPRTSPYAFQGLGEKGWGIITDFRKALRLYIVTEAREE